MTSAGETESRVSNPKEGRKFSGASAGNTRTRHVLVILGSDKAQGRTSSRAACWPLSRHRLSGMQLPCTWCARGLPPLGHAFHLVGGR